MLQRTARCLSSRPWRRLDSTVRLTCASLRSYAEGTDSKALSADTRQALWDSFDVHPPLCYSSATLSPQAISAGMLRRVPINLNQQAQVRLAHLCVSLAFAFLSMLNAEH